MSLKSVYDTQEEVPAQYAELFEERHGKWMLIQIQGIKTDADVARVQESLNKERSTVRELKQQLNAWGDLDPTEVHKQLDTLPELEAKVADIGDDKSREEALQARVDARLRKDVAPLERKVAELTASLTTVEGERDTLSTTIRNKTIQDALRSAATKNKVEGAAMEDVLLRAPMFQLEGTDVVTKDGLPGDIAGGLSPDAWLAETRTKYPHWYAPAQGAGARGSNGTKITGNPFTKGKYDSVAAQALVKSDPQKAAQLAKAAGHSDIDTAMRAGIRELHAAGQTKGI